MIEEEDISQAATVLDSRPAPVSVCSELGHVSLFPDLVHWREMATLMHEKRMSQGCGLWKLK